MEKDLELYPYYSIYLEELMYGVMMDVQGMGAC